MHLKYHIPHHFRQLFRPGHPMLLHLSCQFRSMSENIKLWNFLETVDSSLCVADSTTGSTVETLVPITSIRSGMFDIENENNILLATDHVGAACFKGQEQTTRMRFITELSSSITDAVHLSKISDSSLHASSEINVQVSGFFEETARGVHDKNFLKLWSTKTSLPKYLEHGPSVCLSGRLKTSSALLFENLYPVSDNDLNKEQLREFRNKAAFYRPEVGSEKFLWIHVPYTHTGWVPQVLAKACNDQQKPDFFRKFINEENWFSNFMRAHHSEPHARYVRPACVHSRLDEYLPPNGGDDLRDPRLALYLHWDTYGNLVQRRKVVEERLQQGRCRPVPNHIIGSTIESKLIWEFLGREPPIHIRRTLDQYGYPHLRSTVARDDDQILWKRTRKATNLNDYHPSIPLQAKTRSLDTFLDGKVLMVDQLWLWIVDEKTVVTFFPKQEATTTDEKVYEQANLFNSIYNELNGDLATRFETAGDFAALIVLHTVTILLDQALYRDLQVLRIFEESISILTESVTKSFKKFRNRPAFIIRSGEYNKDATGRRMKASERDDRDRRLVMQNREDLSVLLELKDIVDELHTIMKLLEEQTATVKIMAKYFKDKGDGRAFIGSALSRLGQCHSQVVGMIDNANAAQKEVGNLLDLKQTQATIDGTHLDRWQAEMTEETHIQSRSLVVFTVFTVIFMPLSFFTSLFGINVREWSGEQTNLTMAQMLSIAGTSLYRPIQC
ncbi:hypothetical protein BDV59DRAFT_177559 [Aspergillus ambiguus]|uniref:uncharacterized protein n=1 Tax=Aspergillus ambiguus TaxID=176160 RepID=UPI003CCD4A70